MQAVVIDESAPSRLRLEHVGEPSAARNEAVVDVHAVSLNLGEVRRSTVALPGWRPGWDVAGVVATSAQDGSGPPVGARVVGLLVDSGGWATRAAVPTNALAVLPEGVSFEIAATLPVAGLTALYCLERGGLLAGKRVLVTGASGGVGIFATQLARAGGAEVTGLLRTDRRTEVVRACGAERVLVGDAGALEGRGPYDLILDSLGGAVFAKAVDALAEDGELVTFGTSAERSATIDVQNFYTRGGRRIYGFIVFHEVLARPAGAGLARLVALVERGVLSPHIGERYPFAAIGKAVGDLWNRRVAGKAVVLMR